MLPSVAANELEQVSTGAIRTTFHPSTPGFADQIDRLLADYQRLIKGPYVTIALQLHQGRHSTDS
jgi:DEAD/DEAH box helicase domain-containing protein